MKASSEMENTPSDYRCNKRATRDNDDVQDEDGGEKRPKKKFRRTPASKLRATNLKEDDEIIGSSATTSKNDKNRMPEQSRKARGRLGLLTKESPLGFQSITKTTAIFCYLEPDDLLRLARTAKELRCILMSNTSASIWRTARENVKGLPIPLNGLNEPQYAHLCYESYCHVNASEHHYNLTVPTTTTVCDDEDCYRVLWTFWMRACPGCIAKMPSYYGVNNCAADKEYATYLHRDYRYKDILPMEEANVLQRHFIGNTQLAQRFKAEYDALTTEDQTNWIKCKAHERCEISIHASRSLCQMWLDSKLEPELNNIRERQKEV
ncbi:hypothetical protein BDP27DRAFT_1449015 [Rhodocollybia butyracea]|uniref:Uncharacterized protein n=1 Tax=Rhodocollybia butyracea TaxID=206335 RepID=A0A9P5PKT7_9AGAR|nr:hypothetical protein BDP27DRAFT_1449015 [Rhodocollybia butyracea]